MCVLAAGVFFTSAAHALAAPAAELPLGPRSLDERRVTRELAPGVAWTRIARSGGPWRLNVLRIDRGVRLATVLSNEMVGGLERPSAMARRVHAVAGVNGGYFAVDGNPVGVLSVDGRLVSEPVGGRSALLLPRLPGGRARLAALRFDGSVSVGGETRLLDGVNRVVGSIPACGGRGGDRPTQLPDSTRICTDSSELILFTPDYGPRTPVGDGRAEAVVGSDGIVAAVRRRGGTAIPRDGYALTGTGDAATLLRGAAGESPAVRVSLGTPRGEVEPESYGAIVGGGPRLLRGGRIAVRSGAEGFATTPGFFQAFVASRQPRTLVGVRSDGTLLLVTVDGRRRGWSVGVTLTEAARVMRSLGARDALNLDGGGSTAMAVRRRAVNRPSDGFERSVSDGVFAFR
jgi:hypothetical protein